MNLTQLSFQDFKKVARLLRKKWALIDAIKEIDADLTEFETALGANRVVSSRKGSVGQRYSMKAGRTRRGEIKQKIVAALKVAGRRGMHVKDLAKKLGAKDNNVRVWFYATGKKIKNIKQTKPATYAWIEK